MTLLDFLDGGNSQLHLYIIRRVPHSKRGSQRDSRSWRTLRFAISHTPVMASKAIFTNRAGDGFGRCAPSP